MCRALQHSALAKILLRPRPLPLRIGRIPSARDPRPGGDCQLMSRFLSPVSFKQGEQAAYGDLPNPFALDAGAHATKV